MLQAFDVRSLWLVAFALLAACGTEVDSETALGGAFSSPAPGRSPRPLRFSAIPDTRGSGLSERYAVVAQYLQQHLGIPVEYRPSPDYGASVEAFVNGDIDCAWFGGVTGVQARALRPGSRAIVQGAEDRAYVSYFIAHRGTGLPEPTDQAGAPFPTEGLAGKSFTFASPKSTSGRVMPEYWLRQHVTGPLEEYFSALPAFAGTHDRVVAQVNAGTYDVGAVNYRVFDRLRAAGKADNTYVVWQTPPFADYNFTVRGDLDSIYGEGSIERLQKVLVDTEDEAVLAAFDRSDLVGARNEEYAPIVEVCQSLGFVGR